MSTFRGITAQKCSPWLLIILTCEWSEFLKEFWMPWGPHNFTIYDHCEFTDLVNKFLIQHCCISNGHIHVTKVYPVCPDTLPVQVTFLWGFCEKEHLQTPGCLALTASLDHSPSKPSLVQLCKPTTVTAYSQLCWVQQSLVLPVTVFSGLESSKKATLNHGT